MRITFLVPANGVQSLSKDLVNSALSLVGCRLRSTVDAFTMHELLLAYDWAMRVHLSASGNPIRKRLRPSSIVEDAPVIDWPFEYDGAEP